VKTPYLEGKLKSDQVPLKKKLVTAKKNKGEFIHSLLTALQRAEPGIQGWGEMF
jgi:hypothetical protein